MEALIFPALLFILMYMVLIRPQQRRQREAQQLLDSLQEGDEVVLNSGIHGFITAIEDKVVWLEVAADTELKVSRSAVGAKIVDDDIEEDDDAGKGLGDTDVIEAD